MFSHQLTDGTFGRYRLASRWPRIWRTKALGSTGLSFALCCFSLLLLFTQTSDLRTDAIPDFHFWFVMQLLASALATAIWLSAASKHFEVGSAGYRTRSPTLPLLFAVMAVFWLPTFLYAYQGNKALASVASEEVAGRSYLYMQRAASFFGASAHFEDLKLQPNIPAMGVPDTFSSGAIREEALRDADSFEIFAPIPIRGILSGLLRTKLTACADMLLPQSKTTALEKLQQEYNRRGDSAQTDGERENVRRERASELDSTNSKYESHLQSFRSCLDKAVSESNVSQDVIAQGFRLAQKNAYLIYYANKGFGAESANYLQFAGRPDFAAAGLYPLLGDITVLGSACWLIFFIAIFYRGMEYVGSAAAVSAAFNSLFFSTILVIVFSVLGLTSTIPQSTANTLTLDTVASLLHWPSLVAVCFGLAAVFGCWSTSSTTKTRSAILVTYICMPVAIAAETLNAVNTISTINYVSGACSSIGGWGRIHCEVYTVWQPLVRAVGSRVAVELNWQDFTAIAGDRVIVSSITAMLLAFPASWFLLFLIKREFVRPRQS
jgi:hypothetical protein